MEEIEYYKTHACPKGEQLFRSSLEHKRKVKTHPVPLSSFLMTTIRRGDLLVLLLDIAAAVKITSATLRRKSGAELEALGFKNYPDWKKPKKCEICLSRVFNSQIKKSGSASVIGSRLYKEPVTVAQKGNYAVVVSAVDGAVRMTSTGCMGSVFGIYPMVQGRKKKEQVLQKGSNLLCAGYALYGSSTVLYIALRGRGTHGFTLQTGSGEFILIHPNVKMPCSGPVYSLNEGRSVLYEDWFLDWLNCLKNPPGDTKLVVMSRNNNSKVADIHLMLKWGGLYLRPNCKMSDIDNPHYLVYEMIPLAFVLEEAGGLGTTGRHLLLDVEPQHLHETSQVFIGSKINILLLLTEINPSLLVRARIYALDAKECLGQNISYKKASKKHKYDKLNMKTYSQKKNRAYRCKK